MKRNRKSYGFTLVEVIVALAILTISITGFLQLLIAAQSRIVKSYDAWARVHMLSQAAEYYMLMPQEDPPQIPADIFPYEEYRVDCTYEEIDNLPEEYDNLVGQLPLKAMVLDLRRLSDEQSLDKITIDRIWYEATTDTASSNE